MTAKRKIGIFVLGGIVLVILFSFSQAWQSEQPASNPHPALQARLRRTITGHSAVVWDVAFTPPGNTSQAAAWTGR